VGRFGEATFAAVRNGRTLAADLVDIYGKWSRALTVRKTAGVWGVLPLLLSQPAVTSAVLQQATGLSQPAADNAIRQLRDAGIVTRASGAQRYIVWVADDVTRALDAFAERACRG
jgi:DNA-binding transcriptional ArsR family regulator